MRWCARLIVIFFCTILLVSCQSYEGYTQHRKELKSCQMHCKVMMQRCEESCRNSCENCTLLADAEAAVHFNQYKHQQQIQGSIVALELQSFRDPLQCRKTTCACRADFEMCTQACQGTIYKRLKVIPPC